MYMCENVHFFSYINQQPLKETVSRDIYFFQAYIFYTVLCVYAPMFFQVFIGYHCAIQFLFWFLKSPSDSENAF